MPHRRQYDILIYASNLTGLGSTQVAGSLVEALINSIGQQEIALIVPSRPTWTQNITPRPNLTTIHYRRRLPHRISRLCEVLHGSDDSIEAEKIINLGDLPLKTNVQQLVLVHQSHLISPKVDPYSSKALAFRTMRCLMHCNSKYADRIVVQTDVLKRHLSQSYPSLAARIVVIPQPVPSWLPIEIRGTKEITGRTIKRKHVDPTALVNSHSRSGKNGDHGRILR